MTDALIVGLIIAGVLLIAGGVVWLLTYIPDVTYCPRCGGDLVEWAGQTESGAFTVDTLWRGCPKVRDEGAGSPPGEPWWQHYREIRRQTRRSRFDPYTGQPR